VPTASAREDAADYLRQLVPFAEDITWRVTRDVQFVDCGENFEVVRCPRCHVDLGEWWSMAMEAGHEQRFTDLRVTTPCCRLRTSLNQLDYAWPAGFARCVLEVFEPGVAALERHSIEALQHRLGCAIRVIWAHY
jgi:hypothetical protein